MSTSPDFRGRGGAIINTLAASLVRADGPDLSLRQLASLSEMVISNEAQTVRGLAAKLDISKPAVTRAMDRLTDLGLAKREPDPQDKRSVLLTPTTRGRLYMLKAREVIDELLRSDGTA